MIMGHMYRLLCPALYPDILKADPQPTILEVYEAHTRLKESWLSTAEPLLFDGRR